jgi:hypothetical protein
VELEPLRDCANLRILLLAENRLKVVDLEPLRDCHRLHTLDLARNKLKVVDLEPLRHSQSLEELIIDDGVLLVAAALKEKDQVPPAFQKLEERIKYQVKD